jgi:hypothetical protein
MAKTLRLTILAVACRAQGGKPGRCVTSPDSAGNQTAKSRPKAAFADPYRSLEIGAGEGIRTLDPNLGKVVLYP